MSVCPDVGVFLSELMPAGALLTPSIDTPRGVSTTTVLPASDRLKMSRSYTPSVLAKVVDLVSLGNGADEILVHGPMRADVLTITHDDAITLRDPGASPLPAIVADCELVKQSAEERLAHKSGLSRTSGIRPVAIGSSPQAAVSV
jgi:hypothetical protein